MVGIAEYNDTTMQVRAIGRELGLPTELTVRHPFPGPGLAIRVLCSNGEINMERDFSETQVGGGVS